MINIILTSVQNTENFLIYASITRKQNFLPMQFYLHREEIQFSSRGNFNDIGMGKNQISYPFVIGRKK